MSPIHPLHNVEPEPEGVSGPEPDRQYPLEMAGKAVNLTCPLCESAPVEIIEHEDEGCRWWTAGSACTVCLTDHSRGVSGPEQGAAGGERERIAEAVGACMVNLAVMGSGKVPDDWCWQVADAVRAALRSAPPNQEGT